MNNSHLERLYNFVTGDEDARVCKDIPEAACHHQPKNFFAYLFANVFNKIADELTSAKLVLPWLMATLGAPAGLTGLLVPIREAGVLLPQMLVAAAVRHKPRRKGVWMWGGGLSALSLLLMALVAGVLEGAMAGWALVGLLVVFSLARGLCSVSAKDVLGKTVSKSRRGKLMGWSSALGGVGALAAGLWLASLHPSQSEVKLFIALFAVAVLLWLLALAAFASIDEQPGATEGGGNAIDVALRHLALLKTDKPFRALVIARSMLLAVLLIPPYFVIQAQASTGGDLAGLGWLIIATGLGASLSSPFWGHWGDQCSRCVMAVSALGVGLTGLFTVFVVAQEWTIASHTFFWAAIMFVLTVLGAGATLGRKIYLVDLGSSNTMAAYTAVSNSVMGVLMLLAGMFIGVLSVWLGTGGLLLLLSLSCLLAAGYSMTLKDVSR